jgi:hypothetical protein
MINHSLPFFNELTSPKGEFLKSKPRHRAKNPEPRFGMDPWAWNSNIQAIAGKYLRQPERKTSQNLSTTISFYRYSWFWGKLRTLLVSQLEDHNFLPEAQVTTEAFGFGGQIVILSSEMRQFQ